MKIHQTMTYFVLLGALQAIQLSELVKARQEMAKALDEFQKTHPQERVLFDSQEIENLSLDRNEKDQRPSVSVRQDRYLKPVIPDQKFLEEQQQLQGKRILEQKSKKVAAERVLKQKKAKKHHRKNKKVKKEQKDQKALKEKKENQSHKKRVLEQKKPVAEKTLKTPEKQERSLTDNRELSKKKA